MSKKRFRVVGKVKKRKNKIISYILSTKKINFNVYRFVLLKYEEMVLLFNHVKKIIFKHNIFLFGLIFIFIFYNRDVRVRLYAPQLIPRLIEYPASPMNKLNILQAQ